MPRDHEISIPFDYPDIPAVDATSQHHAARWRDGRWEQYWKEPLPDHEGGVKPIFLAAHEAILHRFGLAPGAVELRALSTTSAATLESEFSGRPSSDSSGYGYQVKRVTTFVDWLDNRGQGWTGDRFTAERVPSGEWVVGRLDEGKFLWVEQSQKLSDLDMWRMYKEGPEEFSAGRLRSFRWKSLFLAHSSADKDFVRTLAERLRALGIRTWVDEAEIRVGDSLFDRIESGIREMDYVGVILSPSSVQSSWVREELKMAMIQQIQENDVVVLPIFLRDADIPGFLREKRYADFRDPKKFEAALTDLLERLQEHFPDPQQDPQPV
jgi:hypothetical protein